jgi:glycosyltransferase involved in cell wall biosynthesis
VIAAEPIPTIFSPLPDTALALDGEAHLKRPISIAVTTYAGQSYYTHACLEGIREWKTGRHEVIVASHDSSLLLEYYLKACVKDGLIDRLIFTPSKYGHTKGVNRCFEEARGELLFNIANDIVIGPSIVGTCAHKLESNPKSGIIGWFWYATGNFWNGDQLEGWRLRDERNPDLDENKQQRIRGAPWFTGRIFKGLKGPKWIHQCNTAFFGIRRDVWNKVGGFSDAFHHYWADDFLAYAVLDQGLNVEAFDSCFKRDHHFLEFQRRNTDVKDRRRDLDSVPVPEKLEHYLASIQGGVTPGERQLLYQIARSLPDHTTVLHVGIWRGASLILFMAALKAARFIAIDCFDLLGISEFSGQPPVGLDEVTRNVSSFLGEKHRVEFVRANTLNLNSFPSADVIFVDAGHTFECIDHDIRLAKAAVKPGGSLIFHDYGQPRWPDVKRAIDTHFPAGSIRTHETLCVIEAQG